ncbi:uncharacterized protein B0I36DRAFT_318154 [Microdochium trichocladiopsis]|uniref:GRF-type domain-containing protein n=1 Tax=Microdochium trichocladiopsis TaxID=1682393 RepID=A0A9P8YBB5_9PEZI|nr:uncharacterized protein B0I36DRAFT_318154 [Microdochium trichocladiopsis]KAH7035348.1 hypothetical protein B0I36DRAFT_318154 [Microdochium trichocladiopsis]
MTSEAVRPGGMAELPAEPVTPTRGANRNHRGNFRNGTWYCDCSPALPCLYLKAANSKNPANNGRHFYSCQKDKTKTNSCGLFMWEDEASSRARNYLLSNGRSELTQTQLPFTATPASAAVPTRTTPGTGGARSERRRPLTQATLENMPIRSRSGRRARDAAAAADGLEDGGNASSGSETASGDSESGGSAAGRGEGQQQRTQMGDHVDASSSSSHTASSRTLRSSGSQRQQQQQASQTDPSQQGTKRKAPAGDDEFSDFSDGEVEELAAIEQRSGGWSGGSTVRTRDVFATPNVPGGRSIFASFYHDDDDDNSGNGNGNGLPTPTTDRSVRRVLFAPNSQHDKDAQHAPGSNAHHRLDTSPTAAAAGAVGAAGGKRQRNTIDGTYTPSTQRRSGAAGAAAAQTPSSSSSRTMTTTPGTSFSSDPGEAVNITADVMELLRGQHVSPAALDGIRGVLDTFARRTAGFERGRDSSRREIRRQQRRIAELEQRAAVLENSRDLDRAARRGGTRRMEE